MNALTSILEQTEIKLYTPDEVCQLLKISPSTLARLNRKNAIPITRIGRLNRYKREDIQEYLNSNRR